MLAAEMRAGGFERVRVEPATHSIEPEGPEQLWSSMVRSSAPLLLLKRRLGEVEWQRREPLAVAYLGDALKRDPVLSTTALLAVGYKPAT